MVNTMSLESDSSKFETQSRKQTFCNLCEKQILEGETVWTWTGYKYFVHLHCNNPEVQLRISKKFFLSNVKKRKTNGQRQKAKREAEERKTTYKNGKVGTR